MAFADWKNRKIESAIAIVAIPAIDESENSLKTDINTPSIATIASIAIAGSHNQKKIERIAKNELLPQKPVLTGIDSVILANNTLLVASNDWHTKYRDYVTCNQCEHLALAGSCSRLGKNVLPEPMRECDSFKLLKSKRLAIVTSKPYSHHELISLLTKAAKPLYHHLIDCEQCSLEEARYCVDGFGLGNSFDCLLLCFDDAADKRYRLMNHVIKARIYGRRVFESLESG